MTKHDNRLTSSHEDLPDQAGALNEQAVRVLRLAEEKSLSLATAESCTGGLLASLLTDHDGLGHCFDRAFVTYTDAAKSDMLGIDRVEISRHGAVSATIAMAMAKGALARSEADVALSITGFAGPAGPNDEAGLVHLASITRSGRVAGRECHFGPLGRETVRSLAVRRALEMIAEALVESAG
jgi:nicotinamide-nucleotide amidase